MTVYIVDCVLKNSHTENPDCRSITLIKAKEQDGGRTILLTADEAYSLVEKGKDRLWVQTGNGFVPVIPAYHEGLRYVRTESHDTPSDILTRQPKCP